MIESRVHRNKHGDPVLTVTVTGFHDAYRFANGMTTLQCEFAEHGRQRIASLRRHFTREGWEAAMDYFHGTGRSGYSLRRAADGGEGTREDGGKRCKACAGRGFLTTSTGTHLTCPTCGGAPGGKR